MEERACELIPQLGGLSHGIEEHPDFRNGGFGAGGFYDHGTRFFEVTKSGKLKEASYFMTYAGQPSAAYWITPTRSSTPLTTTGPRIRRLMPPKG